MDKVQHIGDIEQPRTAAKCVAQLSEDMDSYHVNIFRAAQALVTGGRASHKYLTQWASGTTLWAWGNGRITVSADGEIDDD